MYTIKTSRNSISNSFYKSRYYL